MYSQPRLLLLGDTAVTVEFGDAIAPDIHARVLGFVHCLEQARGRGELEGVVEWVPTFRSVSVYFGARADDPLVEGHRLLALAAQALPRFGAGRRWRLPVCFDAEFAPDLEALARAKALTRQAVMELITGTPLRVYMLGFLPGFAYLGGLPSALDVPRRATPRRAVPARSLAVAGGMCAVYPWESPGGWHLLGRTPVRLFDAADCESPALLKAGDEVRWQAVDREGYERLDRLAQAGALDRAMLLAREES
ncbi:MAG: allophanate hydrolase subunit 1 [Defluviicoccus sp.]|nr:allophanate hydrolase subunit 1 [Defluviicoccus sp.]